MVKYSELPPYANSSFLDGSQARLWENRIGIMKEYVIEPIFQKGVPIFETTHDYDFNKVKQWINEDFPSLVKFFLLCIAELKRLDKKGPKLIVLLLVGQQNGEKPLLDLVDCYDYGHLRRLKEIYFIYQENKDAYYLDMMKKLCGPYLDVMSNVVHLCKGLFKQSQDLGFSLGADTEFKID